MVPITCAGSSSGVNWIAEKLLPRPPGNVPTATVLGGRKRRRDNRAAAIEALGYRNNEEARGLLQLYSHDKEPSVARAAEAALQ